MVRQSTSECVYSVIGTLAGFAASRTFHAKRSLATANPKPLCLFTAAGSQWDQQLLENHLQTPTPGEMLQRRVQCSPTQTSTIIVFAVVTPADTTDPALFPGSHTHTQSCYAQRQWKITNLM